jgi:hypothetical protein
LLISSVLSRVRKARVLFKLHTVRLAIFARKAITVCALSAHLSALLAKILCLGRLPFQTPQVCFQGPFLHISTILL